MRDELHFPEAKKYLKSAGGCHEETATSTIYGDFALYNSPSPNITAESSHFHLTEMIPERFCPYLIGFTFISICYFKGFLSLFYKRAKQVHRSQATYLTSVTSKC